ncbi:MAG TPA: hypothetical protein VMT54_08400 [Candidatus Cybelea sp.]|nr:hypothetical protein [Candidatus Cybelea sp.]
METVFKVIGRINSILFLVLLIGAVGLLAWSIIPMVGRHTGGVHPIQVDTYQAGIGFGSPESIAGTEIIMVPLDGSQHAKSSLGGSASDEYWDMRNALFVGPDEKSAWLFKGFTNHIMSLDQIAPDGSLSLDGLDAKHAAPTKAILIGYVDADTDGDGELTSRDKMKLALAKPDGSGLVTLTDGVDKVIAHRIAGSGAILILYQSGSTLEELQVDADDFTPLTKRAVGEMPAKL